MRRRAHCPGCAGAGRPALTYQSLGQEAERLTEVSTLSASLAATERRATEASDYAAHLEATVETGTAHADELLQEGKVLVVFMMNLEPRVQ